MAAHAGDERFWFPDKESCWAMGHLRSIDDATGKAVIISVDTGIANTIPFDKCHPVDASHLEDQDDVSE